MPNDHPNGRVILSYRMGTLRIGLVLLLLTINDVVSLGRASQPRSGVYVLNADDQIAIHTTTTKSQPFLTADQMLALEDEIFKSRELPGKPAIPIDKARLIKQPMYEFDESVKNYWDYEMLTKEIVKKPKDCVEPWKFDFTENNVRMIRENYNITTFEAHSSYRGAGAKRDRTPIIWFNVSADHDNEVSLAQLRIYRAFDDENRTNCSAFTIAAYHVLPPKDGETGTLFRYVDSATTESGHEGWITFTVTESLSHWMKHPDENDGFYLSVHFRDSPVEIPPEDIGIVSPGGDVGHQPFLAGFFRNDLISLGSPSQRHSGVQVVNANDPAAIHTTTTRSQSFLTTEQMLALENETFNRRELPGKPKIPIDKAHSIKQPMYEFLATQGNVEDYEILAKNIAKKPNNCVEPWKFQFTKSKERMIRENYNITTFEADQSYWGAGGKLDRIPIIWFNVSADNDREVSLAHLSLYRAFDDENGTNRGAFTVTAYRVLRSKDGRIESFHYVDSVTTGIGDEGWMTFSVTESLRHWMKHPGDNHGFYLSVHPPNVSLYKIPPEDIGIVSPGGDVGHQPFLTGFFRNDVISLRSASQRHSGVHVVNANDQTVIHTTTTKSQSFLTTEQMLALENETFTSPVLPGKPKIPIDKAHSIEQPMYEFLDDEKNFEEYEILAKKINKQPNECVEPPKFKWTEENLRMIRENYNITTFEAHQSHQGAGGKLDGVPIVWFNVPADQDHEVSLAQLRLYKTFDDKNRKDHNACTITAHHVLRSKTGQIAFDFVDSAVTKSGLEGWITLTVTKSLRHWMKHPGDNKGLYLAVHPIDPVDTSSHNATLDDIGIVLVGGDIGHQPYLAGFFKKTELNDSPPR